MPMVMEDIFHSLKIIGFHNDATEDIHIELDDELFDGQTEVFTASCNASPTPRNITIKRGTSQLQQSILSAENNAGLLLARIVPGHAAKPLYLDTNLLVLESEPGYRQFWNEIMERRVDKVAIQQLALVLGRIHRDSTTLDQATSLLGDVDLTKRLQASIFEQPYMPSADSDSIAQDSKSTLAQAHRGDLEIRGRVDRLSSMFTDKKEGVVHGDLNLRNVIVKSGHPKLVNTCYCMAGPRALDLGMLLASYMALYHIHMLNPVNNDAHRQVSYKMMDACTTTMDTYLREMGPVLSDEDTRLLFSHIAGFTACELIRRSVGSDPYPGLVNNPSAMAEVYASGRRLITKYESITDIGRLLMIGLQLC